MNITRADIAKFSPAAQAAIARQLGQAAPVKPAPSGFCGGVTVYALVRTVSEMNRRDHWAVRNKRKNDQQAGVGAAFGPVSRLVALIPPPYVVTLTRIGGRKLDDDNLAGALKAVQDAVAGILWIDDGDESAVTWARGQLVGKELRAARLTVKPPAVRIRVETRKERQ